MMYCLTDSLFTNTGDKKNVQTLAPFFPQEFGFAKRYCGKDIFRSLPGV